MEFFKANSQINFYQLRKVAAVFSIVIFLASIVSLFAFHLNLGLDFTGGTQIRLSYKQPANLTQIRQQLVTAGFVKEEVQSFGDSRTVMLTLSSLKTTGETSAQAKVEQDEMTQKVLHALPGSTFDSRTFVGAKVSGQLAYKGILAVVVAMLATMIYIAFRFEWRLALGAIVALIHDPMLILGVFSFFHVQFDLTALAAVLTIIGYSLHDTIVVFDRVRENFRIMRRGSPIDIMNSAINQTLSRTVISASLTFIVVVVLFLIGGPSIHAFALALIVGIVIGTYSSIYVAGSVAIMLGLSKQDLMVVAKKTYDDMP